MNAPISKIEIARAFRFAIVGISIAAIYAVLYFLLRKAGFDATIASLSSLAIAFAVQYAAHTAFTFRSSFNEPGQLSRFLVTVTLGTLASVLVTMVLVPTYRLPEWVGVAIIIFGLPITNFIVFRLWVYRAVDSHHAARGMTK